MSDHKKDCKGCQEYNDLSRRDFKAKLSYFSIAVQKLKNTIRL